MYTHVLILRIKGYRFSRNLMCDATHHKSFGLGLTAFNGVHRHIVYILDGIFILLYKCIYNILWVMLCHRIRK